jgi:hypothetical protein
MVTMSDSSAVRQQRYRRHKAGDHSACRRGCNDARASRRKQVLPARSGEDLDPAAALRDLAAQLQAAYEADPGNGLLARELRQTLLVLMPSRDAGVDAELRALMADLSRPVPRSETGDWLDGG